MLWALPLGMAALGALQSEQKRKDTAEWNKKQAELHKYSPWTGMKGEIRENNQDAMGGALQGGVAGLGMAQGMGGWGGLASGKAGAVTNAASSADVMAQTAPVVPNANPTDDQWAAWARTPDTPAIPVARHGFYPIKA